MTAWPIVKVREGCMKPVARKTMATAAIAEWRRTMVSLRGKPGRVCRSTVSRVSGTMSVGQLNLNLI